MALLEQHKEIDARYRKARRQSGIAKFERNCRCTIYEGRRRKAYMVPGTQEAGRWAMLRHRVNQIAASLKTEATQ